MTNDTLVPPSPTSGSPLPAGPADAGGVRDLLISILTEIQEMGGNEVPVFDDDLCVLMEVSEFDSLTDVEAESILEQRLGTPIPDNLFFDRRTGQPATLDCVVDQLCRLMGIPCGENGA